MKTATKAIEQLEVVKIPRTLKKADVEAFKKEALKIYKMADAMIINDATTQKTAAALSVACSDFRKRLKDKYGAELDKRDKEKREATAKKKELVDMIEAIVGPVKEAMDVLDRKDREWIKAENDRIERENQQALLDAQKKADEEKKQKIEDLKEVGTPEAKQAIKEIKSEPAVPSVALQKKISAGPGRSHVAVWTSAPDPACPDSLKALVDWALQDWPARKKYVEPCTKEINQAAKDQEEKFAIPGFIAYDKGSTRHY